MRSASLLLLLSGVAWATPPEAAPSPQTFLAQLDDSDVRGEETLEDLWKIEYDKNKQEVSAAIGLSLIPGGGFGLVYAKKKPQAIVPIILSLVGYGVGTAYLLGTFDESSKEVCRRQGNEVVPNEVCSWVKDPEFNHDKDEYANDGSAYFENVEDYQMSVVGEDFDGKMRGIYIIAGTYAATTLLGAVWSASTVSEHNERLRKDIESTTEAPTPLPKPLIAYDGERGFFGLSLDF